MDFILKSFSFIFHPLFMPLIGVLFYFSKSPRFLPKELIYSKLISVSILTIILPLLIYFLLKTIGKVKSIYLKTTKERILPLAINLFVLAIIVIRVFPEYQVVELHYFFIAILMSTLTCLILAILHFKVSIHMIALAGVLTFFMMIAIQYSININGTLILMFVICGATATSRLHTESHTPLELIAGSLIGCLPQIMVINYWF